jgi:hypothetical protein
VSDVPFALSLTPCFSAVLDDDTSAANRLNGSLTAQIPFLLIVKICVNLWLNF